MTDKEKRARGGISAFLVDKGTPGFNVLRRIPDDRRRDDLRGRAGGLPRRGLEAARHRRPGLRADAAAPRHAAHPDGGLVDRHGAARARHDLRIRAAARHLRRCRSSERQAIQWWVADAATKIHAARLMTYDCAWKLDQGRDGALEISMIKAFATEMA